jgi:hypothetical protein
MKMREQIIAELATIERAEQIRILYAVESGSRAWGFPSQNSDYDVRFLYLRPMQSYLSIAPTRDVIEKPIAGYLDVTGWDMQKALALRTASHEPCPDIGIHAGKPVLEDEWDERFGPCSVGRIGVRELLLHQSLLYSHSPEERHAAADEGNQRPHAER